MQEEKGLYNNKIKSTNKNYPVGENGLAGQDRTGQDRTGQDRTGQGRAGQDRTGQDRTRQDARHRKHSTMKLAQDCRHKEIIKGANEEGDEITQVWQINQ